MSKPPKIDRKTLRESDKFVLQGRSALGLLSKHRSRFVSVFGIALVIVAGVYAYDWWTEREALLGWTAFNEASKAAEREQLKQLPLVFEKFGNTRPGFFAAVKLADYYFDERKKELLKENPSTQYSGQAGEWYSKALKFNDITAVEKQLLYLNLGQAFELEKNFDASLIHLKLAVDMGGDIKGLALLHTAFVFELKNDLSQATDTYQRVVNEFLNTEYARMAKNHLRQLKSPLFSSIDAQKKM